MAAYVASPGVLQVQAPRIASPRTDISGREGRSWALPALVLLAVLALLVDYAVLSRRSGAGTSQEGSGFALLSRPGGARADNLGAAVSVDQISQRLLGVAATTGGELEISLAWNTLTDLDLEVRDPAGELITARHRQSASGGVQDVDANPTPMLPDGERRMSMGLPPGRENVISDKEIFVELQDRFGPLGDFGMTGSDSRVPSLYTRTPVEHTCFAHAPRGIYTVYVHCFAWCEPNGAPLPYTIQVRSRGRVLFHGMGTIGPADFVENNAPPIQACRFAIR
jgi:hypothetical protein